MAPRAKEARETIAEWSKEGLELELASRSKTGFKDIIILANESYGARLYDSQSKRQVALPGAWPSAKEAAEARAIFKRERAKTGEPLPAPATRAKRGEVRRRPRSLHVHLLSATFPLRCREHEGCRRRSGKRRGQGRRQSGVERPQRRVPNHPLFPTPVMWWCRLPQCARRCLEQPLTQLH